jgi:hypothetical protein
MGIEVFVAAIVSLFRDKRVGKRERTRRVICFSDKGGYILVIVHWLFSRSRTVGGG